MADSWLKFKPEFAGSIVEPSENPLSGQWQTETLPFRLEKHLLSSWCLMSETLKLAPRGVQESGANTCGQTSPGVSGPREHPERAEHPGSPDPFATIS